MVEAEVRRGRDSVIVQWTRESAYRFFPLVTHDEFGLTLHPFDLATSKVLALVGRVEPRDFVDTLTCHRELQPLGYLAWAACGKDPGFSPAPTASELSLRCHSALADAREVAAVLPAEHAGEPCWTTTASSSEAIRARFDRRWGWTPSPITPAASGAPSPSFDAEKGTVPYYRSNFTPWARGRSLPQLIVFVCRRM